jgi:hypothetical protein
MWGGVEYQDRLYETLVHNYENLGLTAPGLKAEINLIHGDASKLEEELDDYDWFYFFSPFEGELFEHTIQNICRSMDRVPRKVHIIYINPDCHEMINQTGRFYLTNQIEIMSRTRITYLYESRRQSQD